MKTSRAAVIESCFPPAKMVAAMAAVAFFHTVKLTRQFESVKNAGFVIFARSKTENSFSIRIFTGSKFFRTRAETQGVINLYINTLLEQQTATRFQL
ncbi:MAG: hypothetical protein R2778_01300 [Saprospiraceae bacterium]